MKYRAKRTLEYRKDDGLEDYGIIECGALCDTDIFDRCEVISYQGNAVCDIDSKMAEDCFEEVVE